MLQATTQFLLHNTLPALAEYYDAEDDLSLASKNGAEQSVWQPQARTAKRKAGEVAVALDSLADRAATELGQNKSDIRAAIQNLCIFPGGTFERKGCYARVRGVANAYKHGLLSDTSLPIASDQDFVIAAAGWGIDGWGVGKFGGIEVMVNETAGQKFKFMGDAPTCTAAWLRFLVSQQVILPESQYHFGKLKLYP